jgi:hypothetical protein
MIVRRAFAAFAGGCLVVLASMASAQVNPPVPAPSGPVNPAVPVTAPPADTTTPATSGSLTPAPSPAASAAPGESPAPGAAESPAAGESATPTPTPTPTPPPIVVDPAQLSVEPGKLVQARVNSAAGTITATSADPSIATVVADQNQRAIFVTGVAVGSTTVTVADSRGVTRDVPIRVAYAAGSLAEAVALRVTGDPASPAFVRDAVVAAAQAAATLRPGARITVMTDAPLVHGDLQTDDRISVNVPLQIQGDAYITVNGTTRVDVENFALPHLPASQLLVSDYPERLTANGVLFTATIDRTASQRFLYYHFNPGTEPGRRILVKAANPSNEPATVHLIAAIAGPGANEMEVGHNATKTFLVRTRRNEGTVVTIPPDTTVNLINHPLPPNSIVTGLLQVREVSGDPLNLSIVAQDANAPLDQSPDTTALLAGGAPHARGVYPVPAFFSDYTFFVDAPPLEIPIGQLPLPNLRSGEALSGDYGVQQSIRVVIVNTSRYGQAIALYANPRGGAATGTFLIDNTLVQAHRLPAFSKYKIWQETIAPGTYRTLQVTTFPEGGSSYPLRLIFAQDDGSVAPGAPGSPIY